jgi:putative redox protein
MTSTVKYEGDLRTTMTHLKSEQTVTTDAPTDNHGKGEAFSPTDLFSTAWASCMVTTMAIAAENRGWSVAGTHAEITKIMSADAPRRIAGTDITIYMADHQYSDEQKTILERTARTCPISKSVHPDVVEKIVFVWA